MSFADEAIRFNSELEYTGLPLPAGIRIMNPFRESEQSLAVSSAFYEKYYNDNGQRHIIWGINPGRFGGGLTGIPFTDPKRLVSECGIAYEGKMAHEPSSVFIYEMIHAFGGIEFFYKNFYINSPCPLGFTSSKAIGKEVNYNYYDSPQLQKAVQGFMAESVRKILSMRIYKNVCFCLGTGKNEFHLQKLNDEFGFFERIIALEHPRFIVQYKSKAKQFYIDKYVDAFRSVLQSGVE